MEKCKKCKEKELTPLYLEDDRIIWECKDCGYFDEDDNSVCKDCGCFIEEGKIKCNKCYLDSPSKPKTKWE